MIFNLLELDVELKILNGEDETASLLNIDVIWLPPTIDGLASCTVKYFSDPSLSFYL